MASNVSAAPAGGGSAAKVSHWDFMLYRQHDALAQYLARLAAIDARDGSALVAKVLDQRCEQVPQSLSTTKFILS